MKQIWLLPNDHISSSNGSLEAMARYLFRLG